MQTVARYGWIPALILGLVLLVVGSVFIAQGVMAKDLITSSMADEGVTTSKDAAVPNAPVVTAAAAQAQQDLIKEHTLGRFGPYSSMSREDPNRDTYLKGLTIRTALNLSVLGFGVADMAIGLGAILDLLGVATIAVVAPVLFAMRRTLLAGLPDFSVGGQPAPTTTAAGGGGTS